MADAVATPPAAQPVAPVVAAPPAVPAPQAAPAAAPAAPAATAPPAEVKPEASPWSKVGKEDKPADAQAKPAEDKKPEDVKFEYSFPKDAPKDLAEKLSPYTEALTAFAKEQQMTPKQAQALLDRDLAASAANEKAVAESLKATNAQWYQEMKAAHGQKWGEYSETVKRGYDAIDPDGSLRQELAAAHYDNYPKLTEAFYRVGKMVSEDKLHVPSVTQPAGQDTRPAIDKAADVIRKRHAQHGVPQRGNPR